MHEVKSIDELDEFIINNSSDIVMLYFGASWCGPCELLKKKLSTEESMLRLPKLRICYIDIDLNDNIASLYKIKSLPAQIFIKLKNDKVKVVSKIEGYDYTKLLLQYEEYNKSKSEKIDLN